MKKSIKYLLGLLLILVLTACGDEESDLRGTSWGMSVEEVKEVESNKDNELYSENVNKADELVLEYKGIQIDGYDADVEFIFVNRIDKIQLNHNPKFIEGSFWDMYDALPETIVFEDFILVEGEYRFIDLSDTGKKEILDSLISKYGKIEFKDNAYTWMTDTTHIYYNNDDFLKYTADYQVLKKYVIKNENKDGNDTDL